MAADKLPDFDELAIELVRLKRREPELLKRLERAEDRLVAFPSAFGEREVARLRQERQTMVDRIDELNALLLPIRRIS
jgi:predicted  nucleic acid-binding Zn-ribbon protein